MYYRCLISALLVTGVIFAQTVSAADTVDRLQPIVITATRTAQPQANTLAATTVITRAEIEHLQPQSVQELLRWTPGISVSNSGGPGKATSIHMRGTGADHTLVLINGVRYSSAFNGTAAVQDIPVSSIKRIEIVRGPRSSLYGADAIGGVIQIFTRDGANMANGLQPYFTVGGGSYGTYSATAGLSGHSDDAHFNVTLSRKATDGFNAHSCTGASCYMHEPDDDGYERTSGSLRAGFDLGERGEVNVHAMRFESHMEFDGGQRASADSVGQILGTSVSMQLAEYWQAEWSVGHEMYEKQGVIESSFGTSRYTYNTKINTLRWQNDFTLPAGNNLIVGVDYRGAEISGSKDFDATERDTKGLFVQYLGRFGAHQFQLALRGDDHERFDDSVTGSINYGWHIDSVHTLTLSYGTAYNVPSFVDLYYPQSPFGDTSNPDLQPEQSASFELGFKANRAWGHWAVYAYQTTIDDLIVAPAPAYYPRNISKARIRGIEASVDAAFGAWYVNASADYVDAVNRSDSVKRGNQLAHRPQVSAQVRLARDFGTFRLGGGIQYGGSRYEDAANTVKLDDFVLVGLRGSWQVTEAWQLQASVDNIFDTEYHTVQYYNQPGRTFYLSVNYRP